MNKKHATINNYILGKTLGSGYQAKVTTHFNVNFISLMEENVLKRSFALFFVYARSLNSFHSSISLIIKKNKI